MLSMNLPIDAINEVKLEAAFWGTDAATRQLFVYLILLAARLVLNFNEAVVSKTSTKSNIDDLGIFGTTYAV